MSCLVSAKSAIPSIWHLDETKKKPILIKYTHDWDWLNSIAFLLPLVTSSCVLAKRARLDTCHRAGAQTPTAAENEQLVRGKFHIGECPPQ